MGKTIAEKILGRHAGREVSAGEIVVAEVDLMMSHDGRRPPAIQRFQEMGGQRLCDPGKMVLTIDHYPHTPISTTTNVHKLIRSFAREQGCTLYEVGDGICHQLVPERGHVLPGQLVIGTDSHSTTYGALNCFATGIGDTDMAAAMISGKLWFTVPETLRVVLHGRLPRGVYSKDAILHVIGAMTADGASFKAVEFTGEIISQLSMDARLTVCNMAVEMEAKAAIMEADETVQSWLRERTAATFEPVASDPDASLADVLEFELSSLAPQVSRPHSVDDVVPVEEVLGVPIQQANLVSCTNTRLEDLAIVASILAGKRIHRDVRLYLIPASRQILSDAMGRGIVQTILDAGGALGVPSCGACSGGSHFGVPADGENVITAGNRNFRGRAANPEAFLYLASPATVAASALEGRIADCRNHLP